MRLKWVRWGVTGVFLSVFAVMALLTDTVAAANFTIANCFRQGLGSWGTLFSM